MWSICTTSEPIACFGPLHREAIIEVGGATVNVDPGEGTLQQGPVVEGKGLASQWWDRTTLVETAFLALTVVFGLQLLRVLLTGLVFYIRDSLDAGSITPGAYALVLFLLAFLAPTVGRFLGPRRSLVLIAAGLALMRLAEQMVPWAAVDLGLSTVGTVLFLLFIPTYIGHLRTRGDAGVRPFAYGLLLGFAADTAIKGGFGTLDLSWQPKGTADGITVVMFVLHAALLWTVLREKGSEPGGDGGFLRSIPLIALGPILFLELLLYQNIGQQTVLIGWDQAHVVAWLVLASAIGLVLATEAMVRPDYGGWAAVVGLFGLFPLLVIGERSGLAAAIMVLIGQAAISLAVATIALAVGRGGDRSGIGGVSRASGLGMLILLVLAFLYYSNYQFDLPGGSSVIPPLGGAIILVVFLVGAVRFQEYRPLPINRVPAVAAILLLAAPLGYLAAWDEPRPVAPPGYPVRVMSYNLHQGFDVDGDMAIEELAEDIEAQGADIVALQEVSRGWVIDGSVDMLVWLSRRLEMPYVWGPAADSVWGNAVLSRYPILGALTHPMPNNFEIQLERSYTVAQIDVGAPDPLVVIATHLHHVEEEGHLRTPQVLAVIEAWGGRGSSVILGDLNAEPDSPEIRLLEDAGLRDSFVASGARAEGNTGYTARSDDLLKRIDYIWISPDIEASAFALTDGAASDHLGLAVTLDK